MALGALALPAIEPAFGADNTAMVPVTAGNTNQKLGTIEIRSPMDDVMDFFAGIDKSLINLVQFAKKSFRLEEKDAQRESLQRQDTDDEEVVGDNKSMLDSLKESFASLGDAFGQVSIGEKLGAALLVGGLLLFSQVQEQLVAVLTPVIAVVKKLVDDIKSHVAQGLNIQGINEMYDLITKENKVNITKDKILEKITLYDSIRNMDLFSITNNFTNDLDVE